MKQVENQTNRAEVGLWKLLSAIFLVAGTCIGGGMLALPVATGISGLVPSSIMMIVCWFFMTLSALLLLEANLWLKQGAHVITMAGTILGQWGKVVAWVIFLFISYASLVAYTAAGGSLVVFGSDGIFAYSLSKELGCLLFIAIFGSTVYLGSSFVGRINSILFVGLILAYIALISTGVSEIKYQLLTHMNWRASYFAVPLLLTTFSFQTMLPSLTPYLHRNASYLRLAIVGGTTLTLIVYLLWQTLVLGVVPLDGPNSLVDALAMGEPITQFLRQHVSSSMVSTIAEYFAFFALITSFLGIALGLFDFLSDGLNIKKKGSGNLLLTVLIVVPVFIFSAYFERIFLVALETTGGFGDSILNGIMPALMVYVGRYQLKFADENRTPGGKALLIAVMLFFLCSLILEILISTGFLCLILDLCNSINYVN